MKVLIAEDDPTTAMILSRTLSKAGYTVDHAINGVEALKLIEKETYDALCTDWMMPCMDGIELIRQVRALIDPPPIIVVITALVSESAEMHALDAGADEYLAKPFTPSQVLTTLGACFAKRDQPAPRLVPKPKAKSSTLPPYIGIAIAASTGGPEAVIDVISQLPPTEDAAIFIVLHGPAWMLESFSGRLQRETRMEVELARDGVAIESGTIYVAPGDHHLQIDPVGLTLELADTPPENFVRPSADPLFRSIAEVFGYFGLGIVMTGLGRDGSAGAASISESGGVVVVQEPSTCVATSMPETVINLGLAKEVVPLNDLANSIADKIQTLSGVLQKKTLMRQAEAS